MYNNYINGGDMRLPDPFTNPSLCPGFETADLVDNDPMIRDEMPNGKVLEVKSSAQYWGINITMPDLLPKEFFFLDAFIGEYKRTGGYIDVLLPQYENVHVRGGAELLTIASGQKGSTVVLGNLSALTGRPVAGDIFQLSTHPKVYKITKVATTATTMTLSLYPDLFITTTGAEKPVFNGILFQTKLMNGDAWSQNITNDGVYTGVTLNLREAL